MRRWYEVKAINKCGNVEMSDFASYGPDCWDAFDDHLAATILTARISYPDCEIVIEQG